MIRKGVWSGLRGVVPVQFVGREDVSVGNLGRV